MFVVAGVTGRVGSQTAQRLLDEHEAVRVLVRRQADAVFWESRGAEARVVELEQSAALADALVGSTGLFTLLPFDLSVEDTQAHADTLTASIAGAVEAAKVAHVVLLSSAGADLDSGTGPIVALHRIEQALRKSGAVLTALRSGHFQEKFTDVLEVARRDGIYPVFAESADIELPMVATSDIGAAAAAFLQEAPSASQVIDLIGPAYTERTVAARLGEALGRDLEVTTIAEEGWVGALMDAGFSAPSAEVLAEMYRADEQGLLSPRGDRSLHVSTPIETTIHSILGSGVHAS